MKKLTEKIKDFSSNAWGEIEYSLRMLCGKPTPAKRFVLTLIAGGTLAVVYIYFVVSSIYNMGVNEAKKNFIEWQHIKAIELQKQNDSINVLNQKQYE
jgi:hypothetical protein